MLLALLEFIAVICGRPADACRSGSAEVELSSSRRPGDLLLLFGEKKLKRIDSKLRGVETMLLEQFGERLNFLA